MATLYQNCIMWLPNLEIETSRAIDMLGSIQWISVVWRFGTRLVISTHLTLFFITFVNGDGLVIFGLIDLNMLHVNLEKHSAAVRSSSRGFPSDL